MRLRNHLNRRSLFQYLQDSLMYLRVSHPLLLRPRVPANLPIPTSLSILSNLLMSINPFLNRFLTSFQIPSKQTHSRKLAFRHSLPIRHNQASPPQLGMLTLNPSFPAISDDNSLPEELSDKLN